MICSISSFTNNIDLKNNDHPLKWIFMFSRQPQFILFFDRNAEQREHPRKPQSKSCRLRSRRESPERKTPSERWTLTVKPFYREPASTFRMPPSFSGARLHFFRNAASTFQETRRFRPQDRKVRKRERRLFFKSPCSLLFVQPFSLKLERVTRSTMSVFISSTAISAY